MSKKLETWKIKVNNFSEMFAEIQKWKNSGGEWKLLERRDVWIPRDGIGKSAVYSKKSFVISNGEKKVNIGYEEDTPDIDDFVDFWGSEGKKEVAKIFSESSVPLLQRKVKKGQSYTVKNWAESNEIKRTSRYLNAWSLDDVRVILVDYYQTNKSEIDQFNQKNYSHGVDGLYALAAQWLEVGEDDQLFYIWVGKRDPKKGHYLGGGEWEICLKKSDLVEKYTKNGHKLIECAGSQGVQVLKSFLSTHWMVLTDAIGSNSGNESTIAAFENNPVGFDPNCYDQNGNLAFPIKGKSNDNQKPDPIPGQNSNPPHFSGASKIKEQVRHYMEQNDIFRLTLENGKLIVEYNKTSKKEEKEINSEDLKTIQSYLKEHNNSVSYEQLKFNSPNTNKDKKPDYTPWIISGGILILVAIFVYFIIRKSKRLPNK